MDASKLKFKVCGMGPKPFFILFAVVLIAVYGNFMPLAKIYSNASGNFVVSSYVLTVAFLMAMGGLFFWLGNTIPIVNNYLGGACLLPLIGASWLNYVGSFRNRLKTAFVPSCAAASKICILPPPHRVRPCHGSQDPLKGNGPLFTSHHWQPGRGSCFLLHWRKADWLWGR